MQNAQIPGKQHFLSPDTPAYREGYDNVNWDGEGSPAQKQIDELKAHVEKLLAKAAEPAQQTAPVAAKQRKTRLPQPLVEASCGREFRGNAGVAAHARGCDKCKEAAA